MRKTIKSINQLYRLIWEWRVNYDGKSKGSNSSN